MALITRAAGGREIFLRNLPFDATAEDLEQLCSELGPVKRASIIQGGEGRSRGFGFVKFAVPEDADRAVAQLNGSDYKGRPLRVEVALKKGQRPEGVERNHGWVEKQGQKAGQPEQGAKKDIPEDDAALVGLKKASINRQRQEGVVASHSKTRPQGAKRKAPALQEDPKTLLVFNVSEQTTEKQLFKRVKKFEPPKLLKFERLDDNKVAIMSFETTAAARKVQKKLDEHVVHGSKLAVRRLKTTAQAVAAGEVGAGLEGMRGHAKRTARVIVRNLSFYATPDDLKESLRVFGPVLEAVVPTVTVSGGAQEKRGFGFVTFAQPEDAAKAVASQAPLKVRGREVAVDLCLGRQEYEKKKEHDRQEAATAAAEKHGKKQEEGEHGRDEQAQEEVEEEEEEEDTDGDDDDDENEEAEERGEDDEDDEEEEEEEVGEKGGGKDRRGKNKECDVGEGKTLFARNVPFDATNESLKEAFAEAFGTPVVFAAVVKDKNTSLSKGTAFVKFKSRKGLEMVLEAAKGEPDGSLFLLGRRIKVDQAVEKEQAPSPATASGGVKRDMKVDRRNLYLANEGLVIPNQSSLQGGEQVPQGDLDKRKREQEEKKTKLRNPLFFVSPTRLSVRNLGKSVSDQELRAVILEGARRGIMEGKVTAQDLRLHHQSSGKTTPPDLQVPSADRVSVNSVKVMKDLDRKPVDGVYPSRGYAFAEFPCHAYALAALRHVNNNPEYSRLAQGGGGSSSSSHHKKGMPRPRLIVSFAVEDHRVLKKKELRVQMAAVAAATAGGKAGHHRDKGITKGQGGKTKEQHGSGSQQHGEERVDQGSHKSRGKRQRERRKAIKEQGGLMQQERVQQSETRKPGRRQAPAAKPVKRKLGAPVSSVVDARNDGNDDHKQLVLNSALREQEEPGRQKKRRRGVRVEEEDKAFSNIVAQYKEKLFRKSDGSAAGVALKDKTSDGGGGGLKRADRWFEGL